MNLFRLIEVCIPLDQAPAAVHIDPGKNEVEDANVLNETAGAVGAFFGGFDIEGTTDLQKSQVDFCTQSLTAELSSF